MFEYGADGEKIVTDRAAVAVTEQIDKLDISGRYDSGCVSGGNLSSLGSPVHQAARQYNRLDSGYCERVSGTSTPTVEPLPPKTIVRQPSSAPVNSLEFFDTDSDGDCQLHLAIAEGVTEVVFALIRLSPHPVYLDIQNNEMYAPLHIAVLVNQPRIVRRLVVAGATTTIQDREGNTPFHLAARRGFKECASALLSPITTDELREAGIAAAASPAQLHGVLNMSNYQGEHSVHLATFGQHYEFLWFLNLHQADMNATEGRSGKTALHYAVNMRDEDLVRVLVTARDAGGCGVQVNKRDWYGRTALRCARINGDESIVRFLSAVPNADPSLTDSDEDYEFDTDDEMTANSSANAYNDIEVVNGSRFVEMRA